MNLQEDIQRIHQMMGIINENKVVDIIQEMGLYDATRYFGGYDNVTKIMGDYVFSNEEMIDFIKDVIKHLAEERDSTGISTYELNMNAIPYGSPDDELHQIEYFHSDFVTIDVYDGEDYERHKSSFTERYEDLDDNTLDEVFLFMVDALKYYK
jgi:hypothetical protein